MSFNAVAFLEALTNPSVADADRILNLSDLPVALRVDWLERAAILENDGGLSREEADRQALDEIWYRYRI